MSAPITTPTTEQKPPTSPPPPRALKPIEEVRNNLTKMTGQFKMALPSHIPVEKFIRVAQTAIGSNASLLDCDRASLFQAVTKSAQAGLIPDGKEAALVPFKGKVQFLPMVAGILKLIRNSGELSSITSQIVYKNDPFKYWIDEKGEHLNHTPDFLSEDRGDAVGVYSLAILKDGAVYIEFLTKKQVMDVKNVSRSKDSGPWAGAFELEMWKKTSVKRLSKRLPVSTDLDEVFKDDDEDIDFGLPNSTDKSDEIKSDQSKPAKKSRLKEAMANHGDPIPDPATAPQVEDDHVDADYHEVADQPAEPPEQRVPGEIPL